MDILTPAERSERMSRIGSKNTKPELAIRQFLHHNGYRYRIHGAALNGRPDIVFPRKRKVIFVHGCFWHAHADCRVANRPKSRTEFWDEKFAKNIHGEISQVVDRAEAALLAADLGVYQRGGLLVTTGTAPVLARLGSADTKRLFAVDHYRLTELLTRSARWKVLDQRSGGMSPEIAQQW